MEGPADGERASCRFVAVGRREFHDGAVTRKAALTKTLPEKARTERMERKDREVRLRLMMSSVRPAEACRRLRAAIVVTAETPESLNGCRA